MPRTLTDRSSQGSAADRAPVATIEVVACDGSDVTPVVVAAHGLQAVVRQAGAAEAWFEQTARAAADPAALPADLIIFVGSAERMAQQRWIARAAATAPTSLVVAALVDTTLDHAMTVVSQGARGLLVLPNPVERLTHHLREVVEVALRCQADHQAVFRHRRALGTLSPAELEVLEGMLAGMPNKQVAQRLSIGLRTVELRRSKIMKKMKAKSLAQLISYVTRAQHHGC